MIDKVLIVNVTAQKAKYGVSGYRRVRDTVSDLVAADAARGLKTLVVDISDPLQTRKYRAPAVLNPRSEVQNKNAIDRIYAAVKPHYLVLMDGPDVIPHIVLNNPIPNDRDKNVPSDLPYASDAPFTQRHIATYAAVTRVVGRIPGVTGAPDPTSLISQIKTAGAFKSRRRNDYLSYFAISSYLWRKSTKQSVDNIFRSESVEISPPTMSPKLGGMQDSLSHFINCDGKKGMPNFYGVGRPETVVSMTSDDVAKWAKRNTIVAAECCYGAQLFEPSIAGGKLPIANAYLNAGATAFFGSTSIAFGAREGNFGADLMAQYFLINVLGGASIGRACVQARQKFVRSQKMENPVNLKVLAQFILLGDPSLQPIRDDGQPDDFSEYIDVREARRTRRVALAAAGEAAAACSGFPGKRIIGEKSKLHKLVRKIALRKGFKVDLNTMGAYHIIGRENYANEMKARDVKQSVFVVTHRENLGKKATKTGPLIRVLVAHAQNDRLTEVCECVRL